MKRILSILALPAIVMGLSSCNEKKSLADKLAGTWISAPERIATDDTRATTTVTATLTFTTDVNTNPGGNVSAAADFSILTGTEAQAAAIQPISVSASGKAYVTGRWEAVDNDEIMVTWDYSTLKVDVAPEAVEMEYDVMTSETEPVDVFLKSRVAKSISSTMTTALSTGLFRSGKIDDIEFSNNGSTMTCETSKDHELTFSKFLR